MSPTRWWQTRRGPRPTLNVLRRALTRARQGAPQVAELDRRPDVTHVPLAGLDQAAVAELLATEQALVSA